MFLYKSNSGLMLSLIINFILSSMFVGVVFVVAIQFEWALYLMVSVYSLLTLLALWKTIYQSSHASLVEQNGELYHYNGFRAKCLGEISTVRTKPLKLLPFVYVISGGKSKMYCLKWAYSELIERLA